MCKKKILIIGVNNVETINNNYYINVHMYLNFFFIPKVIHNLSAPTSANKCRVTAKTIMTVSFAIISIRLQSCETAWTETLNNRLIILWRWILQNLLSIGCDVYLSCFKDKLSNIARYVFKQLHIVGNFT